MNVEQLDGGGGLGTVVVVPMYRCESQIGRVIRKLAALEDGVVDRVVLVDNRSPDRTLDVALAEVAACARPSRFTVLRNQDNYGLGGSHKIGFEFALQAGAARVVIVHGDDQAHVPNMIEMLDLWGSATPDAVLGGRFSRGAVREGYGIVRTVGNVVFNALFSLALRQRVEDLGAGLNVYSVEALASRFYLRFADDLTFNVHLLVGHSVLKHRLVWHPITWREVDQQSNVRLFSQGRRTLRIAITAARQPRAMLEHDLRADPRETYSSVVVAGDGPRPGVAAVEIMVP